MADDIVERLRLLAKMYPLWGEVKNCSNEAADGIERLRTAGDALVDAVLLQRWSTVDVAVAAWLEARRER